MTRYFLFEYDDYYPSGGFDDLTGIFNTENEALAVLRDKTEWLDIVEVYSLENDAKEPVLLYYNFRVLDGDYLYSVVGDDSRKIIKLVGSKQQRRTPIVPQSFYPKMSNYKVEEPL